MTSPSATFTKPADAARSRASAVRDSSEPTRCERTNGQRSRQPSFGATYAVIAISPLTLSVSGRGSRSSRAVVAWTQPHLRIGGTVSFPFHGNGERRARRPVSRSTPMTDGRSTGNSFAATVFARARMSRSEAPAGQVIVSAAIAPTLPSFGHHGGEGGHPDPVLRQWQCLRRRRP